MVRIPTCYTEEAIEVRALNVTMPSDYMQTYFGVDANNAARSGLNQFSAEGGIRDIRFPLMAIFSLNPKWHITGGAIISLLTGDAADSPVIDNRGSATQIFAGVGIAYAW